MTQNKILNSAGIVSGIGLATLSAFLTFAPMFAAPDTYADEAKTAQGEVRLKIGNGLAISATNVNIVDVTPSMGTGENTFVTGNAKVNVLNTSARSGYYLTMSSESGTWVHASAMSTREFSVSDAIACAPRTISSTSPLYPAMSIENDVSIVPTGFSG